jgi:arylsulfatase A
MKHLNLILAALVTGITATAAPTFAADRPNVIVIMADDMGYECVTANGGESYKTPRLDKLAATGIRFEHGHSQPICTPSRVQIMTGIYNNRNYIEFGILDPEARTFGHLFKQAGYKTVVAGKWQLKGGFEGPYKFGFDEYCLWQLTRRPPRYPNPGVEINGKEIDYKNGEYGPDIMADYICDFMERNQDKPFFVYYPMIPPHWPFQPTPDSKAWNPDESREYPRKEWRDEWFADMVTYTDKMVGKIVDKLEELKLRENTLVIFTGDNGNYVGLTSKFKGRDYKGGKGSPKDNGTHVPLIVNWPGTAAAGKISHSLVDFSDILPTIADVAGIKVPAAWEVDGVSFADEIRGGAPSPRKYIYCWYQRNGVRATASQHTRDQRYKLYATGKFYDVVADFNEQSPLDIGQLDTGARAAYDKLKTALDKHMADTVAADPIQKAKRGGDKKKLQNNKQKNQKKKKKAAKPAT